MQDSYDSMISLFILLCITVFMTVVACMYLSLVRNKDLYYNYTARDPAPSGALFLSF